MEVKIIYHNIHDTWFYEGCHHVYPRSVHDTKEETITASSWEDVCKVFYEKNNRLRHCNGSYYTFANQDDADRYKEWQNNLSHQESFDLYYGGGIVD